MTDAETDADDTRAIPTRQWVQGLAFVAIVVAALVALGVWVVSTLATCGCTSPA